MAWQILVLGNILCLIAFIANFYLYSSNYFELSVPSLVAGISKDNEVCTLAYNVCLLSKGILLNSEIGLRTYLENINDQELRKDYKELMSVKDSLSRYVVMQNAASFSALKQRSDKLEKNLMRNASNLGDYTSSITLSWKDVEKNLNKNTAAIEFLACDSDLYAAIIRNGYSCPTIIKVCDITEFPLNNRHNLYDSEEVGNLIWKNILKEIGDVTNIIFSPSGILHQIAIECLLVDKGERISDKYTLKRVSSTREICRNLPKSPHKDITLFGGIDFNADANKLQEANKDIPKTETHPRNFSSNRFAEQFDIVPLPGTELEVNSITEILAANDIKSKVLRKNSATEEQVKAVSQSSSDCLHIATHGFFFKKESIEDTSDMSLLEELVWSTMSSKQKSEEDKMLTMNGLLFAGASNYINGGSLPEGLDDGILTAYEIANLDFSALNLVTLSACETGLGAISSEGVFGLQRGFKKAGANSILMSLWKVDDAATCKLMTEFYSNWIGKKMTKHDALEAAKRTVREIKGWEDAKYWAAFILLDGLD